MEFKLETKGLIRRTLRRQVVKSVEFGEWGGDEPRSIELDLERLGDSQDRRKVRITATSYQTLEIVEL